MDDKTQLGKLGEQAVLQWLLQKAEEQNSNINYSFSTDPYDTEKDIVCRYKDGTEKHIEVKTQVPLYYKRAVTARVNQIRKIMRADSVFFVLVPLISTSPYVLRNKDLNGRVYQLNPEYKFDFSIETIDGRQEIVIPIEQRQMHHVHTITDPELLTRMAHFSLSKL